MEYRKHRERIPKHLLSLLFIYPPLVPMIFLDLFLEVYHRICFPLYGYPYVKRSAYIRIDRHKLSYLRWWQKLNCIYCGYANGLVHYATVIAGETERYWCSIQHKKVRGEVFYSPEHHKDFVPYGDKKALEAFLHEK